MEHTINYKGFEFEFKIFHQPAEAPTRWNPGCGEEYEIYDITLNGINAEYLLEDQIEEFEKAVLAEIEEHKKDRY